MDPLKASCMRQFAFNLPAVPLVPSCEGFAGNLLAPFRIGPATGNAVVSVDPLGRKHKASLLVWQVKCPAVPMFWYTCTWPAATVLAKP